MEIITGIERRRRWGTADKPRIVDETQLPGPRIADVARRYEISRRLLWNWHHQGKRPVSPALLNPSPRADTTDLKALHKVEVKVDAGRNDRGDHGARAPAALEP